MLITNKDGPKSDPCDTPLRTGSQSDVALLSSYQSFTFIFSISLRCGTLSKALAKAMYIVSTGAPL